jgi:2-phospho-L-lactate/phosphoenolpyruvate guanylyltransferase
VTADRAADSAARGRGVRVLNDPGETGQSAAASIGVGHALASDFERVLLVPGDTPLLDPVEVDALLERSETENVQAAIVPDRHGSGTNALLLAPPDAIEPSFGPDSLQRHVAAAREAGIRFRVEPLASLGLDVDTPDDLAQLAALLEGRRGQAPMTRGALRQLDRSQVSRSAARPRQGPRGSGLIRVRPVA